MVQLNYHFHSVMIGENDCSADRKRHSPLNCFRNALMFQVHCTIDDTIGPRQTAAVKIQSRANLLSNSFATVTALGNTVETHYTTHLYHRDRPTVE